jgi:hypothetical protein
MKILIRVAAFCMLAFTLGCGTPTVQKLLSDALPATFTGNVDIKHDNPYFSFDLKVGNLRKGPGGMWEFDWLVLDRKGFSRGTTVLGTPPGVPAHTH